MCQAWTKYVVRYTSQKCPTVAFDLYFIGYKSETQRVYLPKVNQQILFGRSNCNLICEK